MNQIIYAFENGQELPGSLIDLAPRLREIGFDGLELPVYAGFFKTDNGIDLGGAAAAFSSAGLEVTALSTMPPALVGTGGQEATSDALHALDRAGTETRSRLAVLRLPATLAAEREEFLKTLAGTIIQAYNHCEPAGMGLAVEFREGGVLGSYRQAMDWLYFHSPETGLAVDLSTLAASQDAPYLIATELGPVTRLVYLGRPGNSGFDYHGFFSGLKAARFGGPLALRGIPVDDALLASAVNDLRQQWAAAPVEAVAVTES